MRKKALTAKQKLFLDFSHSYRKEHAYSPSQEVIATHFPFQSLGTVQNYLNRLESQGYFYKSWNAGHGIQVSHEKEEPSSSFSFASSSFSH